MAESDTVGAPHARQRAGVRRTAGASTTVEVALVDQSGVIVAVNDAWTAFGAANGADPDRTGVGVSYLDVCESSSADRYAATVAAALRTALDGELPAPAQVAVLLDEAGFDVECSELDQPEGRGHLAVVARRRA